MTLVLVSNDFFRTMVISIAKLVVCFCFCVSFGIKLSAAYQVTQRDSKHNSERTLNHFHSADHPVKYPNFNKVMTRIENLNDEVKTKSNYHKIRHKGWNKFTASTTTTTTTEAGLFETYGDLNEDDYFESYEDNQVRRINITVHLVEEENFYFISAFNKCCPVVPSVITLGIKIFKN